MSTGSPTCRCLTGFTGPNCNQHTCSNYCNNGGKCTVSSGNQPTCQCSHDFLGDQCQYSECQFNLVRTRKLDAVGTAPIVCVCVCEQGAVRATASTKVHACRLKTAPSCAAVSLGTWEPPVRSTNATTVVTASVSPPTVSHPRVTSPAGRNTCVCMTDLVQLCLVLIPLISWPSAAAQTEVSNPAVTPATPTSTVQTASAQ